MWFKVTETYNWEGVSVEIYEKCIKNNFANKSEYIEGMFNNYYKVKIYLQSTRELIDFVKSCGKEIVINQNEEIEIYNGYRE
ncbi:hypothetical protein [Clostridium sp.]|uniref:hypothetical protein n=1 Tax=Clostridium sp. TaxID=1506 RepID=UPI00290BACC6|nr:hypothetical protein [Clostridium sp.]MDU3409971.1 hypothetical protein [Clostridium sp.]